MARSFTSAQVNEPRAGTPLGLTGLGATVAMGLVGAVGGIIVGAVQEALTANHWLGAEYYWSTVLAGNALVLGFGWTLLALSQLRNPRWLSGSLLATALALLAALLGGVVTKLGVEIKLSFLVIAALPTLLAGVWLARAYAGTTSRQMVLYLAIGAAWILIGWAMAAVLANQPTPNKVALPGSIPLWIGEIIWWLDVPLVLIAPLLAAAVAKSGVLKKGLDLLLLAAGFVVLPVALAGCFAVTVHLIPD